MNQARTGGLEGRSGKRTLSSLEPSYCPTQLVYVNRDVRFQLGEKMVGSQGTLRLRAIVYQYSYPEVPSFNRSQSATGDWHPSKPVQVQKLMKFILPDVAPPPFAENASRSKRIRG